MESNESSYIIGPGLIPKSAYKKEDFRKFPWLQEDHHYHLVLGKVKTAKPLGRGAYGTAFECYPCTRTGVRLSKDRLVIKIPNVDSGDERQEKEIRERLDRIRHKNHQDFSLIRERLRGCRYANTLIDLAEWKDESYSLPVTIQPYLEPQKFLEFDAWCIQEGYRDKKVKREDKPAERRKQVDVSGWTGVNDRSNFLKLSLAIARAIEDLHLRRVIHADIHTGNFFGEVNAPSRSLPVMKFIDFGEAILDMQDPLSRKRNPHPYLAPELAGPICPLNEQVDVYSFGILMLYLATGKEEVLQFDGRLGTQRATVHQLIEQYNPSLISGEPRILDVIGRCVARDPADRPRMLDVCDDLADISRSPAAATRHSPKLVDMTLRRVTKKVAKLPTEHPILVEMISRQLQEFDRIFNGLHTGMVEVKGTRDQNLRVLVSLMNSLREGDSWSAATTISVWQRSALGLNGSYSSANIHAVRRKAAIRRAYLVSVEELGVPFCTKLIAHLNKGPTSLCRLGQKFQEAVDTYRRQPPNLPLREGIDWNRSRFGYITDFLHRFVADWGLQDYVMQGDEVHIRDNAAPGSKGLYLGIAPVATLDQAVEKREANPAALMHMAHAEDPKHRWLLVTAETRGRRENRGSIEQPHLVAVRVYQSVLGDVPSARIAAMQALMSKDSVNVAAETEQLKQAVEAANSSL